MTPVHILPSILPPISHQLHLGCIISSISTSFWTVTLCVTEGSWPSFWKLYLLGGLTVSLQAHTVPWHSGTGGYMGNLIPYFISIAALPLGAARRKFSHHKGLSGCDIHHRMYVLGGGHTWTRYGWGKNTDVIPSKQGRHQAMDRMKMKRHFRCCVATEQLCSKEHLPHAHPAVLCTGVSCPRVFRTCCWRLYPVGNEPPILKSTGGLIPRSLMFIQCRSASQPTKAWVQNTKHKDVALWLTIFFLCPTSNNALLTAKAKTKLKAQVKVASCRQ